MPRTKQQFEDMRNVTKEKIHTAAMHLFARKGLAATNVQDIADKAGISIGLLYRHYKTKESLFYELAEFAFLGLKELNSRLQSEASPKAMVQSIVDEIYHDLETNEDFTNLMVLMMQALLLGEEEKKMANLLEQDFIMIHAMSDLIDRGQKADEFRSGDSYEMSVYFFSAIQGITISKMAFGQKFKLPSKSLLTAFLYKEGMDGT